MSSWVKGECKHTREHLWQNVRSFFGGSGGRGGAATRCQRQNAGRSIRTYVGAERSWGLVLLEALLWSGVHRLGKLSTSASLCSSALSAVEVRGGVLCTVTGCWDGPGWCFEDGSSPSPQKDLLRKSAKRVKYKHSDTGTILNVSICCFSLFFIASNWMYVGLGLFGQCK